MKVLLTGASALVLTALMATEGFAQTATAQKDASGGAFGGNAAADMNFIPVGAIDHVEVLQDGAAAQYGTDAIAGVVNIILKKASHGGSISWTGGHYFDQGGLTSDIQANVGFAPN